MTTLFATPESSPSGALKRQVRAAEYRRMAMAADTLAENSALANVREKHEQAAARWTALAVLDEQPTRLPPALTDR
jgi:hypothetical protein